MKKNRRRKTKNPVKDLLKQKVSLQKDSRTWGELSDESLGKLANHKDQATAWIAKTVINYRRQARINRNCFERRTRKKEKQKTTQQSGPDGSSLSARGVPMTKEHSGCNAEGECCKSRLE